MNPFSGATCSTWFPDNPEDPDATGAANPRASLTRVVATGERDAMAVQKYDIRRPEEEGGAFEERYWSPDNSPVIDGDKVKYIIHRVEDVTDFVRAREQGIEQARVSEQWRSRANRMEAEIFDRARQLQDANHHLRQANEELARRDQERALVYERLHRLDDLKTKFFANVSHELRTPLALILGPIEGLLATEISPAQRRALESAMEAARLLRKHVDDLLDVAKLEAGKMAVRYAEVNVADVV